MFVVVFFVFFSFLSGSVAAFSRLLVGERWGGDDGGFVGDVEAGPAFPVVDYFTPPPNRNVLTIDS